MVASGEEEYEPASGEPIAALEIDTRVIMGTLKIILADLSDPSATSITELARATLQEMLEGVRARLTQGGAVQQVTLNPGEPDERRP